MMAHQQYIRTEADLEKAVAVLRAQCPHMAAIAEAHGAPPMRLRADGFAGLVRILIGQQVSVAAADAILKKFHAQLPEITPVGFLALTQEQLTQSGLSAPKQRYITGLAEAILAGALDLDGLASAPPEEVIAVLTAHKGIGPWTADMYLLSCLGFADSFPAGDLALQHAVRLLDGRKTRPGPAEATEFAERWRPYRAVAARMLWVYYSARDK